MERLYVDIRSAGTSLTLDNSVGGHDVWVLIEKRERAGMIRVFKLVAGGFEVIVTTNDHYLALALKKASSTVQALVRRVLVQEGYVSDVRL